MLTYMTIISFFLIYGFSFCMFFCLNLILYDIVFFMSFNLIENIFYTIILNIESKDLVF